MARSRIKDRRRVGDHFARKAKADKYPARSVYKLEEADRKHRLIRIGFKVIDLGCAPGSWTLYAAQRVGPGGCVIGLDLQDVQGPFPDNVRIVKADVLETAPESFEEYGPFDVVLSDMAPRTTGQKSVDQARSVELARAALHWARALLKPGGSLMFKVFQGSEADVLFKEAEAAFHTVRRIKPKSSRSFSFEIFGLGMGFGKK